MPLECTSTHALLTVPAVNSNISGKKGRRVVVNLNDLREFDVELARYV